METGRFYGRQRIESSSDDSEDESIDPLQVETSSSDTDSDADDGTNSRNEGTLDPQVHSESSASSVLPTVESNGTDHPHATESAWHDVRAKNRGFVCTAREQRHYSLKGGEIEPLDVYKIFLTDEVIDLIITETNRYFDDIASESPITRCSKMKDWKPVNAEDIKQFLGILIVMGLNRQPEIESYWSKNEIYGVEIVKNAMPRNKFELILRFLHFADYSQADESDRLYKLRPLIQLLSQSFEKYTPGENVVIDESLVLFRGRTILRQYIPNKKHKYGFKFYKLCSVEGYTWRFRIYTGRGEASGNLMHSEYITLSLMEGLLREGRTLYVDNYYSSVAVSRLLLEKSTYVCGTLRKNRKGVPKSVTQAKLKRGEVTGKENSEGIKVVNWKDKRNVLMMTTVPDHTASKVKTGVKKRGTEIEKPQCILDYNSAKKGVDYSDQMASYYSPLRKVRKWYKKAAFELLLGTAMVNSYILFNKFHTKKPLSMKEFRESIAQSLITGNSNKTNAGREPAVIGGKRNSHYLVELEGQCRNVRKRCRGCYEVLSKNEGCSVAAAKARRVKTVCLQCENKPHLCPGCFERTHTHM
jgi:hypothetical protein